MQSARLSVPLSGTVKGLAEPRSEGRLQPCECQMRGITDPKSPEICLTFRALLRYHLGHGSRRHAQALQKKKRRCVPETGQQNGRNAKVAEDRCCLFHASLCQVQPAFLPHIAVPGKKRVKKARVVYNPKRRYKVSDSLRGLKLRCRVRSAQMLFCRVSRLHSSAFLTYFCITIIENLHLPSTFIGVKGAK